MKKSKYTLVGTMWEKNAQVLLNRSIHQGQRIFLNKTSYFLDDVLVTLLN